MKSSNIEEPGLTSENSSEGVMPAAEDASINGTTPLDRNTDAGDIQPSPAPSPDERIELDSQDNSETSAESDDQEEQSVEVTQLSTLSDEGIYLPPDIPDLPEELPRYRRRWILWSMLGVLLLALIAAGSVYAGYNTAISARNDHRSTQVAGEAANQYVLAQQDIALGNYDLARQRLEYIILLDPNYPGVKDLLASVLTQQRITASPTMALTPTPMPTPDYRSRDELFTQAQSLLAGRDWTATIDTLLQLRKSNPDYMAVKVDDMLFVALRNRGIDKIAQEHDLEGGNYDLSLAERFGPLDAEANNWREWAEMYIRGASFWDVDWGQAVYYFTQLADAVPNLSDVSGWTASNRYMDALRGYGDWLAARSEFCDAQQQYDTYMSIVADPQVEPTAVYVADLCAQGVGPSPTPGGEVTSTPSNEATSTPFTVETPTEPAPTQTPETSGTPSQ